MRAIVSEKIPGFSYALLAAGLALVNICTASSAFAQFASASTGDLFTDALESGGGGGIAPIDSCSAPLGYAKIKTQQDLSNIRNNMAANYFLCNDIQLVGNWRPLIGSAGQGFSANFNGNNKKIIGLTIAPDASIDENQVGLFASSTGSIKNLIIQNVSITYGSNNIGALAGKNSGTIDNCLLMGSGSIVGSNHMNDNVGGLVGYNVGGSVKNSKVIASLIVEGRHQVGGLIGRAEGPTSPMLYRPIENCSSNAEVRIWDFAAGGLVGYAFNGAQIINSSASGFVKSMAWPTAVGGLVGGLFQNSVVKKSYATGDVAVVLDDAGGLVGRVDGSRIEDSYATGNVQSASAAGGLVGRLAFSSAPAEILRCYARGAATGIAQYTHGLLGNPEGLITNNAKVTSSFFNKDANPTSLSGSRGLGKTAAQLRQKATFTDPSLEQPWNISYANDPALTIWKIVSPDGSDYARLYWENP